MNNLTGGTLHPKACSNLHHAPRVRSACKVGSCVSNCCHLVPPDTRTQVRVGHAIDPGPTTALVSLRDHPYVDARHCVQNLQGLSRDPLCMHQVAGVIVCNAALHRCSDARPCAHQKLGDVSYFIREGPRSLFHRITLKENTVLLHRSTAPRGIHDHPVDAHTFERLDIPKREPSRRRQVSTVRVQCPAAVLTRDDTHIEPIGVERACGCFVDSSVQPILYTAMENTCAADRGRRCQRRAVIGR